MRKKMLIIIIAVLGAVLLLAVAAGAAAEQRPANYFVLRLGQFAPTGDLKDAGYDSGENVEMIIGRSFGRFFALEGGFNHFRPEGNMTESFYYGLYLDVNGAVLTPKLMYRVARFEFYGGIGAGYYWVDNEIDVHTPTGVTESHIKDTVWGYHGLAGASYDLTRTWYLGLEGKYVKLLDFKDTTDFTGRSMSLSIGLRF